MIGIRKSGECFQITDCYLLNGYRSLYSNEIIYWFIIRYHSYRTKVVSNALVDHPSLLADQGISRPIEVFPEMVGPPQPE